MSSTFHKVVLCVALTPLVLAFGACADTPDRLPLSPDLLEPAATSGQAVTPPPRLVSRTPHYPAVAVYIIYREYVNQHPGLTRLSQDDPEYQRYMEKRLRELYPQRGYVGMMRDAAAEMREYRRQWTEYEQTRKAGDGEISPQMCYPQITSVSPSDYCEDGGGGGGSGSTYPAPSTEYYADGSWTGQAEFTVDQTQVPTVAAEADTLQASPYEHDRLLYYESLALGNGGYEIQGAKGTPSRDDLIRMAAADSGPGEISIQLWGPTVNIPLGVAAVFAVRVLFSKWRAESASASYYPSLAAGDTKRDAFRHIYVNVMLRRYISAPLAKAVMDINEWGNANWGARIMDVHNNRLGVEVKYEHFRGHWLWDRWSYGVWGGRVRNYINDSRNAAFLPALANTYDEAQAKAIRATVPSYIYIYFR
ncbi:DUF6973 domain-containing protein [Longimicrobium sp.]|uniref:DUF6973 domain-containing protein n=1 Tax=Longimicrobium sp. TaxID=2029185 RepID=UPI003B3BA403